MCPATIWTPPDIHLFKTLQYKQWTHISYQMDEKLTSRLGSLKTTDYISYIILSCYKLDMFNTLSII